jgi:hypothetical protein
MAVNKAKSEGFNPLAQIGKAFNEAGKALDKMLKGAPANAAKPPASKRSADKKGDKSSVVAGKRPGGVDGKKNAAVAPQPRMCKPSDAAKYVPKAGPLIGSDGTGKTKVEVIHKFEYDSVGRSLKADNGFMGTGLGKKRDSTFQMVQNQRTVKDAKTGKEKTTWEVHMQPTGEGRKNANVHMFSSNRKVKASDFNANDPANKNIRSKMADGFKRLNEDSNRLPEAPKAVAPKQPTNRWWIDQQARNVAGGLNSAGTSIVSMVGSLPENAVKVGSSIGNTSRSTANVLTGGRVGKTAFNPITTDKNSRYYDAPTNVESGLRGAQKANDKSMGANPDSIVYKTVDTLAPLVLTRGKGKGAGKPGGQKLLKPANPQQQLMPAKGDPVNFGKGTTPTAATPGNAGVKPTPSTPQHGNAGMKPTRVLPDKPVKVVRSSETPIKPVSKEIRQQYKNITAQSMPNGKVKLTQNGRPMSLNDVTAAVKSGHMNKAQLRSAGFSEKVADGILKQAGKGGAAANGAALVKPQPSAAGGSSKPSVKPDSAPKQLSAANAPKQLAPATGSQTPVQLGGSKPSSSGGGKPINTAPSGSGGGSSTQPRASSSSPQRSTNKPGTTYAELPVNKPLDLNTGPLPSTSAPIVRVQPGGKPVQSTKPKPIVESQPARSATPTTTKTPSLDKATQAKVDAANRMQSNPYQPGESINDARQRMGPAFNQKDYNAGSTTPRMSQDPPELSGQTVPQRARTPEQNRTPGLDFAERPTPQPLNISQGQPKPTGSQLSRMTNADPNPNPTPSSAQPSSVESRPLPPAVQSTAERLGISPEIAFEVRDRYGGPFSGPAIVNRLLQRHGPNLTEADAKALVQSVRSEQNRSTAIVKSQIRKALDYKDEAGTPAPQFTQASWKGIEQALNAQPKFDNDATRALFRAAENAEFHVNRGYNDATMSKIRDLLVLRGYSGTVVRQLPQPSLALQHRFSNYNQTDATFAKLVARSGMANAEPIGDLGVQDGFSRYEHPTAVNNARFLTDGGLRSFAFVDDNGRQIATSHGHMVSSVAGSGLGQFGNVAMAHNDDITTLMGNITAMVNAGVKTINLSSVPGTFSEGRRMLDLMRNTPDVKFVIASGNRGINAAEHLPYLEFGLDMPNVTFAGNVNLSGDIHTGERNPSNFHDALLYDYGVDRPVAAVGWIDGRFVGRSMDNTGTSLSAPQIAKTYHQMDYLHRGLSPEVAKTILTETAQDVPQLAEQHQGLRQTLVVQQEDALTVAALGGLYARQQRPSIQAVRMAPDAGGGLSSSRRVWSEAQANGPITLEQYADVLRLSPDQKSRLLPIAKRIFETNGGAGAPPTPSIDTAAPNPPLNPGDLQQFTSERANRPNTTPAGIAFQNIGDTYFRGENLSLNYNGKPAEHVAFAGKNLSVEDLARLSRAPDGSTIYVTSHAMLRDQLSIDVSNRGVFNRAASTELWRSQSTGDIFVKNIMFDSQSKAPSGFGLHALWQQAQAARAVGVKSIQSDAFASGTKPSSTQYVGPYVWGKYGFDAELPHEVLESIQAPHGVTTVAGLYKDPALAARWKDYVLNHSFKLTMHLDLNGSGFDRLSDVIGDRRTTGTKDTNPN